jgi:hypothetical protein
VNVSTAFKYILFSANQRDEKARKQFHAARDGLGASCLSLQQLAQVFTQPCCVAASVLLPTAACGAEGRAGRLPCRFHCP